MKLTTDQIQSAYQSLTQLEDRTLEGDMVWAVVSNLDTLEDHVQRIEKARQRHIQNQVVTDEEGNPVYPEGADPETSDPLFENREQLLKDLQDLFSKEVDVDVQTVSKEDVPSTVKPKLIRGISFMIEDL